MPLLHQFTINNTKYTPSVLEEHTDKEWKEIYDSYVERIWKPNISKYRVLPQKENLTNVIEIIEYCNKHNIELVLFSFPMQAVVYNFLDDAGLYSEMDLYKKILSLYAPIYDMEYRESAWSNTYGLFRDGVHINGKNCINNENPMLSDIFKTMFEKNGKEMRILSKDMKMIFSDSSIFFNGNSELQIYAKPIKMEKDSIYVIKCSGVIPKNQEVLYMDFYSEALVGTVEGALSQPLEMIGNSGECLAIISTKGQQDMDVLFRIVHQGGENLNLENLEIYKTSSFIS